VYEREGRIDRKGGGGGERKAVYTCFTLNSQYRLHSVGIF